MKKLILPLAVFVIVFLVTPTSFSSSAARAGSDTKVLLCHISPGDPTARYEIVVNQHAVAAHLAHGDFLGSCSVDPEVLPY